MPDMTHPYKASEKHRAAFEAWALSYGHDLTDERFYAAAFAGYLAGAAEVERAVAAERERCAKLCADGIGSGPENGCCQTSYVWDDAQDACAAAIRSSAPRANGGEG